MKVKVIIHEAEEGGYWAEVPAIPGCITEGDTRDELLHNLREAVEGCLLVVPGNFQTEEGGREEEIDL
jgi:predicted RNase H-like HicB family nuclease